MRGTHISSTTLTSHEPAPDLTRVIGRDRALVHTPSFHRGQAQTGCYLCVFERCHDHAVGKGHYRVDNHG